VAGAPENGRRLSEAEKLIRKALLDRSMNLQALARELGYKQVYFCEVVRGEKGARGSLAQEIKRRISRYLKIPYNELWSPDAGKGRSG
jgi:hypothetical protein